MTINRMKTTNWPFRPIKRRLWQCLTILCVFLSLFLLTGVMPAAHADNVTTLVSLSPSMQVAYTVGQSFEFYVNVVNVENLSSVSFTLTYNASVLECSGVGQSQFFPPPPASNFQSQTISSLGVVNVNISLVGPQLLLSGNGTLASVKFELTNKPTSPVASAIIFEQASFLDGSGKPIPCDSDGAVCFWQSYSPDPPGPGLLSESVNSAVFTPEETVTLTSQVTFSGAPVIDKLVAFQVLDPTGRTVTIGVVETDKNGIATITFSVPAISTSIGEWTSFSTVDLDQVVFWDVASFEVVMSAPPTVGGTSFSLRVGGQAFAPSAPLVALLLISTLAFGLHKQRRRKSARS